MRVIAIKDSCSDDPEAILVKKGSIYNIIEQHRKDIYGVGPNNNLWYVLLETGKYIHHNSIFRKLTEEELLEEEKEIQKLYDKIKQR